MCGVYVFIDKLDNDEIVYVGKDKHIESSQRFKDHYQPNKRFKQDFNKMLQNSPERYDYQVVLTTSFKEVMNIAEAVLIEKWKPKYNKIGKGNKYEYIN